MADSVDSIDLSTLLSSQARFRVLKALCGFQGARLRTLEHLTGLAIRSVQVAVNGLEKQNMLTRQKKDRAILYCLNEDHPGSELLKSIFNLIRRNTIQARAHVYHSRAKAALRFSDEMLELVRNGRRM